MNISLALVLHIISVQASIFPLIVDLVGVLGWSKILAVKDLELSFYHEGSSTVPKEIHVLLEKVCVYWAVEITLTQHMGVITILLAP